MMPLAAGLGGARPPGTQRNKPAVNASGPTPGPSKPNPKLVRDAAAAAADDDDDDDQETTTDDSSDEEAAFEMDGQELWTQTYCVTCDCLIEPGEGLSKSEPSRASHTSLKSRSGTIKARNNDGIDADTQPGQGTHANRDGTASNSGNKSAELKRTNSAGRIHARGTVGPLGPHKRTGSAGSRNGFEDEFAQCGEICLAALGDKFC